VFVFSFFSDPMRPTVSESNPDPRRLLFHYNLLFFLLAAISENTMSSYFDEHNCEPLSDNPSAVGSDNSSGLLEMARFLILSGHWNNEEFAGLFADRPPPPTSRYSALCWRFFKNISIAILSVVDPE
jgi:hypothetical protein